MGNCSSFSRTVLVFKHFKTGKTASMPKIYSMLALCVFMERKMTDTAMVESAREKK